MKTQKLTTRHLMAAFAVSHMSIHAWRRGSASRSPLPTVKTEGREVLFSKAEVKAWAKAEGVPFMQSLDSVLAEAVTGLAPVKPGPKAKVPVKQAGKPRAMQARA